MLEKGGPSPEHQDMLTRTLEYWKQRGIEERASTLVGHAQPKERNGYIPDAEGWDGSRVHLAEVKTGDDIDNEHSHQQYRTFTGRVMKGSKAVVPFYLVVPRGYRAVGISALRKAMVFHPENTIVIEL